MISPLVSVVMPVYNGEIFIKEAIDSILNQTFTDFEFIIVNDGSTDTTESIILKIKDARIKYIKQANSGIGSSLHLGCSLAKGKYIARMDADDISFPDRLLKQVEFFKKNEDCILVGSAVNYINENGCKVGRSIPYVSDFAIKYNLKFGCTIAHPTVMFNKEAYNKSHGYNKNIVLLEDYILWLDMSTLGKFYNFHFPLLSYRQASSSWYSNLNQIELKKLMSDFYYLITSNNYAGIAACYKESLLRIYNIDIQQKKTSGRLKRSFNIYNLKNTTIVNTLYYFLSRAKSVFSFLHYNISKK